MTKKKSKNDSLLRVKDYVLNNRYQVILFFIFLLSAVLRFYNFPQRIGYGSDSIRDVMIAKQAIERHEIPLIGSFSSAGPFVFGPLFYWFIMLSYLILPFVFQAPWIMMAITGILTVVVLAYLGKLLGGNKLSIIIGLLAATSPQFVSRSTSLNQHSLVGISVSLLILFFILFWQKKKLIYPFLMGISLGIGLSMHYQVINLLIFFPALLFVPKINLKTKIQSIIIMFTGFIIPSLPILIWDSRQSFTNIRNILDYMLIAQYRIYVPNSWKLFTFNYFPSYWSNVVGGKLIISTFMMFLVGVLFFFASIRKKISPIIFFLGVIFFILAFLNRYYRGERFDGYMIYFAPFIFILSAWGIGKIISISRFIGIALLLIIIFFNLTETSKFVLNKDDHERTIKKVISDLKNKYPGKKFSIYDYKWQTSDNSYPLSAFLKEEDLISKDGVKIGFKENLEYINKKHIMTRIPGAYVYLLENDKKINIKKGDWTNVNPESVYDDLMQWMKTRKLTSSFYVDRYILYRLKHEK